MAFLSENTMARRKMKAFLDAVNEEIRIRRTEGIDIDMQDVYATVAESKAPCYFVNLNFAARQLTLISRGKKPTVLSAIKQRMYNDIYNDYCFAVGSRKIKKLDWLVLGSVLSRQAKSFYINPNSVQQLINIYYRR